MLSNKEIEILQEKINFEKFVLNKDEKYYKNLDDENIKTEEIIKINIKKYLINELEIKINDLINTRKKDFTKNNLDEYLLKELFFIKIFNFYMNFNKNYENNGRININFNELK